MGGLFRFASQIRESAKKPDDDALHFHAYQLGGKCMAEFMQKNTQHKTDHPQKSDYYIPKNDGTEKIIRDRNTE